MKNALEQYINLIKEKEETEQRIRTLNTRIENINNGGNVNDAVKGGIGGWQTFHIEGFPVADEDEAKYLLNKQQRILTQREHEIAEIIVDVEKYISTLDDSRMRRLLTKRYIEGKRWYQVAKEMGQNYTEDSCRMDVKRFLQKK